MIEDGDSPVWFGEDSDAATTDLDPEAGTEQTWFNGLEFKPTPRGCAPDIDRDFDASRIEPTAERDVDDIDISVTSSLQTDVEDASRESTEISSGTNTTESEASPDITAPDTATANEAAEAAEPERSGASRTASEHASSERGTDGTSDAPATGDSESPVQERDDERAPVDEEAAPVNGTGSEQSEAEGESGFFAWLRSLFS